MHTSAGSTKVFAAALVVLAAYKPAAKKLSFLLAFVRPMEEKLKGLYNAVHHYRNRGALMVQSFVISVISQMVFFAAIGVLALSISSRISAIDILLRIPIISMMSLLPSLNGLGLREGATVVLFGPLIGKESAFAISILWILVLLMSSFIGGLIYTISPQFRVKMAALKKKENL